MSNQAVELRKKEGRQAMANILITGANFNNKGAQAMLFVTVDEIKKRIPHGNIYFGTNENNAEFKSLAFPTIRLTKDSMNIALGKDLCNKAYAKLLVKNILNHLLLRGNTRTYEELHALKNISPTLTMIIDISGFALGSKWGAASSDGYLNKIRLAKKYGIPIILMPQSFGPFDFQENRKQIFDDIKKWMSYPFRIYAREWDGYDSLTKEFGLENVVKSPDIVLQNKEINLQNIYQAAPKLDVPPIATVNNVAVIPNMRCFDHGSHHFIIDLYVDIIRFLLQAGKQIYLIRHSGEDIKACREIQLKFSEDSNVHLLENNLSCLEYNALIEKFDFAVCSRYHGCIHAYRNLVPCLILGWAVKYQELAEIMGQGDFSFDITNAATGEKKEKILSALHRMNASSAEQRALIHSHLTEIQGSNSFDVLTEWLNRY